MYQALFYGKHGNGEQAKNAITKAVSYGHVPQEYYDNIINNVSFTVSPLPGATIRVGGDKP
jgi:hypothetical protein